MARLRRSGRVSFLRVNDRGGFGPSDDFLDAEAIGKISSEPTHAFGFTLRNDERLPSHQAMLDLLRDGLVHNQVQTTVEYDLEDGRSNGFVIRIELRPT